MVSAGGASYRVNDSLQSLKSVVDGEDMILTVRNLCQLEKKKVQKWNYVLEYTWSSRKDPLTVLGALCLSHSTNFSTNRHPFLVNIEGFDGKPESHWSLSPQRSKRRRPGFGSDWPVRDTHVQGEKQEEAQHLASITPSKHHPKQSRARSATTGFLQVVVQPGVSNNNLTRIKGTWNGKTMPESKAQKQNDSFARTWASWSLFFLFFFTHWH